MAYKETFNISGENLLKKVKDLFKEANVTKITIADKNEKEIISFPVSIGIVGVFLAPIFAAVGAIAAIVAECKIIVERKDDEPKAEETVAQEENPLV
ncbi:MULTISPECIES: DUF4342 domain-containing protein [Sphingobacterium]|uniref:DUF4342 domain-containing protein n=1 Tax=Sphingobacterium litopenaei TaxID=2763500 RepID=A0ABR7Y9N1_9SPHI|nr:MULTISPECIES: DUF4342 domain-containing protein [Sphingobacterium]MBD1428018.1 DUF4342 domain-containing protein [Sphingobacterium litopenaei]NGM72006.1 DUF4342 domain-containing protein [Sphingobacterium sp. SGL-16]